MSSASVETQKDEKREPAYGLAELKVVRRVVLDPEGPRIGLLRELDEDDRSLDDDLDSDELSVGLATVSSGSVECDVDATDLGDVERRGPCECDEAVSG